MRRRAQPVAAALALVGLAAARGAETDGVLYDYLRPGLDE